MGRIEDFLAKRELEKNLRRLQPATRYQPGKITCLEREYHDFSSNDYLGRSTDPRLKKAAQEATGLWGTSASASRLLSGDFILHHELEDLSARLVRKESALLFNCGFQANLSIISALVGRGDAVFSDRLNHASIIDGILLSGARLFRFKHNDHEDLERLLIQERGSYREALIITESVFSMEGDLAPLREIADLKQKYNCLLYVDEAHALGVFGDAGAGLINELGLADSVDFLLATFGKALGGFGAFIATSLNVKEYLINTARGFIYSTALPPGVVAANIRSVELLNEEKNQGARLLKRAGIFRESLARAGFEVRGNSQIVSLIVGDTVRAISLSNKLKEDGYRALPIREPTVPPNQARLRFSLCLAHSERTLENLTKAVISYEQV